MNNDQNNIFGNVTPIQPTNNSQTNTTSSEVSQNQPSTTNQGAIPITPIPEVKGEASTNVEQPQNNTGKSLQQGITPTIVMPETKESPIAPQPQNKELNLESSSPFDIGVNAPLSTNANVNITPEVPNNTPITPITVSNNGQENASNNPNLSNNNQQPQDINISSQPQQSNDVVSVGKYLLHIILFSIPIVGFIILIIKALDKKDKNISNFAKAQLIIVLASIILCVIMFFIAGATIISSITNKNNTPTYQAIDSSYDFDYGEDTDYNLDYDYDLDSDYE